MADLFHAIDGAQAVLAEHAPDLHPTWNPPLNEVPGAEARREEESILDPYLSALGMLPG